MTGLTVLLCVLFVVLGRWQWGRAEQKRELWAQFERGTSEVRALGTRNTADLPRYARVRVEGRWEPRRQFLLDNRTHEGRAGYEVLTPLRLDDGRVLLVNRGWVPFTGYRDRLPDVAAEFASVLETAAAVTAQGAQVAAARAAQEADATPRVVISGRLDELPSAGLAVGRAAPALEGSWPRVTAFPRPEDMAAALGIAPARLDRQLLLLDAQEPRGYVRDWKPGGRGPEQNWSYAIQWWSFAVVLLGLYVGLNLRRTQEESR